MTTYQRTLGGDDTAIYVSTTDDFDPGTFRALFPAGGLYGLDVESTYMDDLAQWSPDFRVRLVQFATVGYAWVLDMADPAQRAAAVDLLSDTTVGFCSHNNMDVLASWTRLGVDITARNVDTLVLANMAHTERLGDRDLKALTTEHIGPELAQADADLMAVFRELWADQGGKKGTKKADVEAHGWANVSTECEEYLVYAGLDAIACRRLVELLIPLTGASQRLLEVETWLAGEANRIQLRGLFVDTAALAELRTEVVAASRGHEAAIEELTGGIKARSPKLLAWFAEHGVDWDAWPGDVTATGNPSLAKENVKRLADYDLDETGRTVAEHLVGFRAVQDRVLKTDAVTQYLTADGCLHPVLRTNGATATARMSSSAPNIQNFSKDDPRTRGVFIPRPGHVLVSADFDQVELRVVAALAGEDKMIEAIHRGDDLHQLTADAIDKPRSVGKMTNFLIVYGGGGNALSSKAGIPLDEARDAVSRFRATYTQINRLSDDMGQLVHEIRTVTGRRLEVGTTPNGQPRSYANINYLVQSSSRDILVDAWYRLAHDFGRGDMVWFPVHDELVLEVPVELVDVVMAEVEKCMTFDFFGVPITASAAVLRDEAGVSRWGK